MEPDADGGVQRTIRLLVVEDERLVGESFRAMFRDYPDLEVVGVAGSAREAVSLAVERFPDVALVDYWLPDGTGSAVVVAIREERPSCQCIILTGGAGAGQLLAGIEGGAAGYLLKTEEPEVVVDAIRRAAAGEPLLSLETIVGMRRAQHDDARQRAVRESALRALTSRERETLELLAAGLDNRSIGKRLGIGLNTVRMHVQNLIGKLGAHSKLEAVVRASELGIIEVGGEAKGERGVDPGQRGVDPA